MAKLKKIDPCTTHVIVKRVRKESRSLSVHEL